MAAWVSRGAHHNEWVGGANLGLDYDIGHPSSLRVRHKHLHPRGKRCAKPMTQFWGRRSLPCRLPTTDASPPCGGQYAQPTGYEKIPRVGKSPFRSVSV